MYDTIDISADFALKSVLSVSADIKCVPLISAVVNIACTKKK